MFIINNNQNFPKAINLDNVKFITFEKKSISFHFMGEDCEWSFKNEEEKDEKWNVIKALMIKGQSGEI